MCHPRASIARLARSVPLVAALLAVGAPAAAASDHAAPDLAGIPAGELPERWRTGAVMGADRSGDLRPAAIAIEDAARRAAEDGRVLTLAEVPGVPTAAFEPPATIRVWRRGLDGSTDSCAGRVDVIPFDRYVKGVLPHEWIRSWQPASLEAGAIAIRTYAAYWVAAGGKYDCADLDDTTASQVYKDEFFPVSDAAVDATAGVFATRGGELVFAEYSAEHGDPTAMGVAEPLCAGRTRSGHGRGTCQWGSQRWAQDGKPSAWIVAHYYPGSELTEIAPPLPEPDPEEEAGLGGAAGGGCAAGGGRAGLGLLLGLGLAALVASLGRRRAPLALLAVMMMAAASAPLSGCAPGAEPTRRSVVAVGGDSELAPMFRQVGEESGVPPAILAAAAYAETRLAMVVPDDDGHAHGPPSWGLFALTDGGVRDVTRAAALGGVTPDQARVDALATTRAAAALLADLARAEGGGGLPATLAGWHPALAAFAGGGTAGRGFAEQVLDGIARGIAGRDDAGRRLVVSARPEAADAPGGLGSTTLALGYPQAIWNPAHSGNYTAASRGAAQINYVVIHTTQGSYAGAISWFKNPASSVSAHYVIRSVDGQITQMVDDSDVAWHVGNFNSGSIGIEHEGFVADPDRWYTESMYMQSAKLTAWVADQYAIPKTRTNIIGHVEAPGATHTDPGPGWDWPHYMNLVGTGGAPTLAASLATANYPREMTSGEEVVAWLELKNDSSITWGLDATRVGTVDPMDRASPFFADGNWLSPSRPSGADHSNYGPGAVGRFTFVMKAPEVTTTTVFRESFQLVQEGVAWFGPVVSMDITVRPVGGDPEEPDPEPEDPGSSDQSGGCAVGGGGGGGAGLAGCAILLAGVLQRRVRRRVQRRRAAP